MEHTSHTRGPEHEMAMPADRADPSIPGKHAPIAPGEDLARRAGTGMSGPHDVGTLPEDAARIVAQSDTEHRPASDRLWERESRQAE